MRILKLTAKNEARLLSQRESSDRDAARIAGHIVSDVRRRGDKGLDYWTQKLDCPGSGTQVLWVSSAEIAAAR